MEKDSQGVLGALRKKRMLVVLLLGFSSGLPIMLLYSSLKIWLRREGIELSTIGYFSWVTVPYSLNFLWSFLLDRYSPFKWGRRKSWLLVSQLGITASLIGLGLCDPHDSIALMAATAFALCFFSATQDIAVDAYRREILPDRELGIGASIGVYGYRVGMLMASGFGLWSVDPQTLGLNFSQMFFMMALLMALGIGATFWALEPKNGDFGPQTLGASIIGPFKDFFARPYSLWVLLFILMFKMGDSLAGSMLGAYYVDMGFDNKVIAEVTKGVGFISSMLGLFVGGVLVYKAGMYKSLWAFGLLQAISTALLSLLTFNATKVSLAFLIAFEDLSGGMGTAAMVAFMASITNRQFTAAQYALFASLASFGRTFVSGFSGHFIEYFDYFTFFISCSVLAMPGLILLFVIGKYGQELWKTKGDKYANIT